jgi:hypothetical protein
VDERQGDLETRLPCRSNWQPLVSEMSSRATRVVCGKVDLERDTLGAPKRNQAKTA